MNSDGMIIQTIAITLFPFLYCDSHGDVHTYWWRIQSLPHFGPLSTSLDLVLTAETWFWLWSLCTSQLFPEEVKLCRTTLFFSVLLLFFSTKRTSTLSLRSSSAVTFWRGFFSANPIYFPISLGQTLYTSLIRFSLLLFSLYLFLNLCYFLLRYMVQIIGILWSVAIPSYPWGMHSTIP